MSVKVLEKFLSSYRILASKGTECHYIVENNKSQLLRYESFSVFQKSEYVAINQNPTKNNLLMRRKVVLS